MKDGVEHRLAKWLKSLCEDLRQELDAQGHSDTRNLSKSIRYEVKRQADGQVQGTIFALDYIAYINRVVRPRYVSRKQVQALTAWFKRKGLNEKDAKGAAWGTAFKHVQSGMPTQNAYAFSSNGRRIQAIESALMSQITAQQLKKIFPQTGLQFYIKSPITKTGLYVNI